MMIRTFGGIICLSFYLLQGIGLAGTAEGQSPEFPQMLRQLIGEGPDSFREDLSEIYSHRKYEPLWVSSSHHLNAEGQALLNVLSGAENLGLNPQDYDYSELQWLQRTDQLFAEDRPIFHTNVLARFEFVLTKNLYKLVDHVTSGRLSPDQINGQWFLQDKRSAATHIMKQAIEKGVVPTLDSLAGGHQGYEPLLNALKQYRQIKAEGGWPVIAPGPLLAKGSNGSRVEVLRQRLAATGDLTDGKVTQIFDQKVVEAVEKFQGRHGLSVDGIVGPMTLEIMNIPVEARIQQVLVNLERHRWMPGSLGPDYILVNIPDYRLTAFKHGEPHLSMPVIVGKPMSQTPIFSDILEYLVFNPYWNVPSNIVQDEILPKVQDDETYLQEKNFELVDWDGRPMDVGQLTKENIEAGTIRVRQKPGPDNALGLVKFMFPNDHAIYLHDTPAGHLFDASERDFSHGCIRVERPKDLAQFLLHEKWSPEDIEQTLQGSERRVIQLPKAVPVYILYLTTWVAEDGTLQFRDDPYGHDEQLWKALRPVLSTTLNFPNHPI